MMVPFDPLSLTIRLLEHGDDLGLLRVHDLQPSLQGAGVVGTVDTPMSLDSSGGSSSSYCCCCCDNNNNNNNSRSSSNKFT